MLNEERIILMTRMASYETGEGKKNVKIGNYFRSDYIALQVLKSVFSSSIVFAMGFALYILYDFETFMQNIYKIDLFAFAQNVLMYYAVTVVVYVVLTYIVCTYRYIMAKKNLKIYYHNLKKLDSLYSADKVEKKTVGGHK